MEPAKIKDLVVSALEDSKGVDIQVLQIDDISDFTDYMVVVSGTSSRHVKSLASNTIDDLREADVRALGVEGEELGEWVLVDFADVVIHVMREEVRAYYEIEKLWGEDIRNMLKGSPTNS
ncbi:MAG: ribosome silencing factor [Proteobacteria bacterium]|nr:ribosome silencing factor [Pseudomonadota bacterium]